MSKYPRKIVPGVAYHAISRFVAREWFVASELERKFYWSAFGKTLRESDWKCFASAIMSNHVHHGLVAGEVPIAQWLGPVHREFAQWLNYRRERIGQVFMRGPKTIAVVDRGIARLIAYIHGNPVRAGVVQDPADSTWTTHRAYLGDAPAPAWLDVQLGLRLAGFRDVRFFEAWRRAVSVTRADLDECRADPPRCGRPRLVA